MHCVVKSLVITNSSAATSRSFNEVTTNSTAFNNLRPSPPLICIKASGSFTVIFFPKSYSKAFIAFAKRISRSSFSSDFSTYTWQRDNRGEITSKLGFSVVAPIKVTRPFSTAPSSESCCDLLKRWISSINKIGASGNIRARSITSRTSFTPLLTALNWKNCRFTCLEIIKAKVVLPTPGGPQNIMDGTRPVSMARRNTAFSPMICFWPI